MSALPGSNATPALPAADRIRPQFGSDPAMAVFTNGELAIARAIFAAASSLDGHDQDQISVEGAASVDRTRAEDARVKPVFRPEQRERRALRQQLGGRGGDEELLFIETVGGLVRIKVPELHTETGVQVFRAGHDRGDALFEGRPRRLRPGGGQHHDGDGDEFGDSFHGKLPFYTIRECPDYGWDFRRCFSWPVFVWRVRSPQPAWCC